MSEKAVHLFPRNLDTDFYNYQKLRKLPGEMTTFTCKEEGDQHSLGRILAPKYLGLKSSCSVMLLVIFSDSLVNCLIGTDRQIHTDSSENLATGFDILIKKNPTSFNEWFAHQHTCIKGMAGSAFKGVETVVTSKQINAFYTKFNIYFSGEDFNSSVTNYCHFTVEWGIKAKEDSFLHV